MSDVTDVGEWLEFYAVTNGLELFPVNPRNKEPLLSQYRATTDLEVLRSWWRNWPDALIGCRIGVDCIVLDVDPRHGGLETWEALEHEYGLISVGRQHFSGRGDGGSHDWFARPEDLPKVSAKRLHEWAREHEVGRAIPGSDRWTSGIDVLTHNWRYTILPPSLHPDTGQPYRWRERNGVLVPPPPFLVELLRPDSQLSDDVEDDDDDGQVRPGSVPLHDFEHSDSIADWFSAEWTWAQILEPHDWKLVEGDGDADGSLWRYPDASTDHSASVKHGCLFVYTPNTPFKETGESDPHGYTRFRAWAVLEHDKDLSAAGAAARALKTARAQAAAGGDEQKAGADDGERRRARTVVRTADQFDVRPAPMLIRGWFPRAEVCMVAGKPGVGKGVVMTDVIARGTRTDDMPNGDRIVGSFASAVICLPGEDDLEEWTRRLTVAGARLDQVQLVEKVRDDAGHERPVTSATVVSAVEDVAKGGAQLVVIDSFTGLTNSARLDTNKGEARAVLDALSEVARRFDITVVVLHHARKAEGDPLDILQGNTQLGAASRAVLVAVEERLADGAEPDVHLFGVAKLNGSRRSAPVGFRLVGAPLLHPDGWPMRDDRGDVVHIPCVQWVTDRTFTQGELLAACNGTVLRALGRDQVAADILAGGPMSSKDYMDAMDAAGHGPDAARRARERVGAAVQHAGRWWSYPKSMAPAEAKRAIVAIVEADHAV
jgi:KaiC/GvpD/RAD55 family RecA-like ATPase